MTKNTNSKTKEISSNVSIVDGKLILSLPNAKMPVVWQSNLGKAQSCSFTIQEDKKAKTFILVLKSQDGSIDEIAHFGKKQDSVDILMEVSSVLQNAHVHAATPAVPVMASNNNVVAPISQKESNGDKKGAFIALALIIVLLMIWFISSANNINNKDSGSGFRNTESAAGSRDSSGVAVSAEDFLSNR